jgi:hypothetical protein
MALGDLALGELLNMRSALLRARLQGIRTVRDQNGEEITYRSDRELAGALAHVESLIADRRAGRTTNVIRFKTSKGT